MSAIPAPVLKPDQTIGGFKVSSVTSLPELYLTAYECEHIKSGARFIHLHTDDSENLFSVNFPTPPQDDTGLPHILEHAVLSGSRLFPVRDPFFEMLKMSMATFINAMTGKDCTYYPVCSNVESDLFNLATVYFDAVFNPLLAEDTFRREGHHLAPADPEQPEGELAVNGIVYNEMKAHYARPESLLWREMCRNLLPDTAYGRDSGGDPEAIPSLTHSQLVEFHRRFYHPSNALILCYGDIATEKYLGFLDERLEEFSRQPPLAPLVRQKSWKEPRLLAGFYESDDAAEDEAFLQMSWKVPGNLQSETLLLTSIVSIVLAGDDAAPLKRALIDSGLGKDLTSAGLLMTGVDSVFAVGIRGSRADRMKEFRALVLRTLEELCEKGLDTDLVESAFRRFRFATLEIEEMRPLRMLQNVLESWLYGGDPLLYLRSREILDRLQASYNENPGILTDIIREHLLKNRHRLDQVLAPDPDYGRRVQEVLTAKLRILREGLGTDELRKLAADATELQRKAGEPNSPEALATLPQLALADLPEEPSFIPTVAQDLEGGGRLLQNDIFTNGVNYLALHLDLEGLPDELWNAVPWFTEVVRRMGVDGKDFAEMARWTSAATGGFDCRTRFAAHPQDPGRASKGLLVTLKALDEQLEEALEILRSKLLSPDPGDRVRMRDVAVQLMSGLETSLVSNGHNTALATLRAGMTEAGYLKELATSRSLYRSARDFAGNFDEKAGAISAAVLQIAAHVRDPGRITASFTGGEKQGELVRSFLDDIFVSRGGTDSRSGTETSFVPFSERTRIGLTAATQVAHCAQVMPAPHLLHPDAALLQLGMNLLRVDYMISELRFKGNAYGASCSYAGGLLALATYADPHIRRTLEVFAGLTDYVRQAPWSEAEMTRGIISTAKDFVRPVRPETATARALASHLSGLSDAVVAGKYEATLGATAEKVREALLKVLEPGLVEGPVAVVSSREKLEQANSEPGSAALKLEALL